MSECMLKLENIVAGYGYGPDIIKNINLELNKGEVHTRAKSKYKIPY